ncbi:MAG: hypothetical protein Tsb002_16510 [Wenzhouxiangellaceae bacterium]
MSSAASTANPVISTPCVGVCTTDREGRCMGCFRSSEEIAGWVSFSEAQRLAIMAELPRRMERYFD